MFCHEGSEFLRTGTTAVGGQEIRNSSAISRFLKRRLQASIGLYLIIEFFSTHL